MHYKNFSVYMCRINLFISYKYKNRNKEQSFKVEETDS